MEVLVVLVHTCFPNSNGTKEDEEDEDGALFVVLGYTKSICGSVLFLRDKEPTLLLMIMAAAAVAASVVDNDDDDDAATAAPPLLLLQLLLFVEFLSWCKCRGCS